MSTLSEARTEEIQFKGIDYSVQEKSIEEEEDTAEYSHTV